MVIQISMSMDRKNKTPGVRHFEKIRLLMWSPEL